MDFDNSIYLYGVHIEGEHNDRPPYTIFADIVFIDKAYSGRFPSVYQLKDLSNPTEKPSNTGIAMLGEVDAISRKEKKILLVNGNTVCYNHLIIINSNREEAQSNLFHQEKELSTGLQTLLEALKLRQQLSFDWTVLHKYQPKIEPIGILQKNQFQPGKKKAIHRMVGMCAKNHIRTPHNEDSSDLSYRTSSDKRLYEIVL